MNVPLEPEKHRALRRRLDLLRAEHRALDEEIKALSATPGPDQVGLRRMKKRKLELRDEIKRVKSDLIPDLNA